MHVGACRLACRCMQVCVQMLAGNHVGACMLACKAFAGMRACVQGVCRHACKVLAGMRARFLQAFM